MAFNESHFLMMMMPLEATGAPSMPPNAISIEEKVNNTEN